MLRDVYVVGVGMTRFGKHTDRTIESLGREAVLNALKDANAARDDVHEAFCGSSFGGTLIGQRVLRDLGMTGIPITNVENACSSGATGLREAVTGVAAGRADTILVIGVEQLTRFAGGTLPMEVTDLEAKQGMTMPALYAMRARRYLTETGATPRHLAKIVVKAHMNGARNPYAHFRNLVTVEGVETSRMIADPLRLYMCCPSIDGAAAAILSSRRQSGRPAVRIEASALQSGLYETGYRDMAYGELTARTALIAYNQAGVGPEDVHIFELHDAFASAEMMYYEALGLCPMGEAARLVDGGVTSVGGRQPVNPSGGLLCRGHPIGATGVAQICEATWQLRGEAGDRQVIGARVALTHCTGGGISGLDHGACTVHILTT
jgi:benzoylsuccinyl-CoA thiolase BbsB subunit